MHLIVLHIYSFIYRMWKMLRALWRFKI